MTPLVIHSTLLRDISHCLMGTVRMWSPFGRGLSLHMQGLREDYGTKNVTCLSKWWPYTSHLLGRFDCTLFVTLMSKLGDNQCDLTVHVCVRTHAAHENKIPVTLWDHCLLWWLFSRWCDMKWRVKPPHARSHRYCRQQHWLHSQGGQFKCC